jgi:signal transduction histidine kinase
MDSDKEENSGNISERIHEIDALREANRVLNRLGSDTRHDILNQLTILLGYLELSKDMVTDPTLKEFVNREDTAAETIRRQIAFTKDFQDIGTRSPVWYNLRKMVEDVAGVVEHGHLKIEIDISPALEIYTDPFLRKIISNLIENVVLHGEKAKQLRITAQEGDTGLTVLFEDDGAGVRSEDKEKIFGRTWPGRKGFGLYLAREVFSITGITIGETGEPGKGARIEINVPEGGYRV